MTTLSRLSGIQEPSNVNPPKVEENLINKKLPKDVLTLIFKKLYQWQKLNAAQVCRRWNENLLAVDKKEFGQLEQFIGFVSETLNQENNAIQILMLERLISNKKILNTLILQQIKMSVSDLKEKILNILKDFEEEELKKLEEVAYQKKKMQFYHQIFDLVRIYKKIDVAQKGILDKSALDASLLRSCEELVSKGAIDKALEISQMISDEESKKTPFFESTFEKLVRERDANNATKLMLIILNRKKTFEDMDKTHCLCIQELIESLQDIDPPKINELNKNVHSQFYADLSEEFQNLRQYFLAMRADKMHEKLRSFEIFKEDIQHMKTALAQLGKNNSAAMEEAKRVRHAELRYSTCGKMMRFFHLNLMDAKEQEVDDILQSSFKRYRTYYYFSYDEFFDLDKNGPLFRKAYLEFYPRPDFNFIFD